MGIWDLRRKRREKWKRKGGEEEGRRKGKGKGKGDCLDWTQKTRDTDWVIKWS